MSWNLGYPEIKAAPAAKAKELLAENSAPQTVKDYVNAGIDGLVTVHGEDVLVTVTGHGHLCDGPASYDVTTATIEVRRDT